MALITKISDNTWGEMFLDSVMNEVLTHSGGCVRLETYFVKDYFICVDELSCELLFFGFFTPS